MKFLIKIEEAVDNTIISLIEKMKHVTPHSVFAAIDWVKHTPQLAKKKYKVIQPKVRILFLKTIGYSQHYLTIVRGYLIAVNIYFKSEEFKKANKVDLALAPIKKFKTDPVKAFSVLLAVMFFGSASFLIFKNTEKIIVGTKALRAPASVEVVEEPIIVFKKIKYDVLEKEIFLDITVKAKSLEERNKLTSVEKEIEELLSGMKIHATQLPLSHEDTDAIEKEMKALITGAKITDVEVKQVLEARPKYFMQLEKLYSMKDLNLQLFLEDTKRNRQVYVDFTCLTSNRNIILFLTDHAVEMRDYLNMHVEPVIPQLPIEEEGRQIIKEKIKLELNQFLKENEIEGKVLDIYVDYLMVS
ncbi:MAG: hypothetical protein H7336_17100 [Bacteriovorax sp.]|nr:hypothetical protein [Bacteriovorax sp.]